MIAACLLAILGFQDPPPDPPVVEQPPAVEITDWDDRTARDAIKEFTQRMKPASATLKERMDAVETLARGRNRRLVDPLARVVLTEKALTVRKAAALALAHQPAPDNKRAIGRLLRDSALDGVPQVQASLVQALETAGYETGADWSLLDGLFDRDFGEERIPLQQAILSVAKAHAELEALETLVRNLDEPIPADPDDPANPPAEYWEARWKAWQVWRGDVKDTLFALTGQRFSTAKEARVWLAKNEKDLRRKKR